MSQNDDKIQSMGIAVVAVGAMMAFAIFGIIGAILVWGYALLIFIVVDWRYRLVGICTGMIGFATLGRVAVLLFGGWIDKPRMDAFDELMGWSALGIMLSTPALGFLAGVWILDFLNDQKEKPTSADAFIAWRRRHGFTKGLKQVEPEARNSPSQPAPFDVPPQD